MSAGGISGASSMPGQLMQVLMQGMEAQTDLSKKMIAVSVENSMIGEKMAIAQQIIDVYA